MPVAVSGISTAIAIAAGQRHSVALLSNGTVMSWGSNEEGQLGSGSKALKSTIPVAAKALTGVTAISAGGEFTLARLSNGTVMAWGAGAEGQLGNGKKVKSTPAANTASRGWAAAKSRRGAATSTVSSEAAALEG